MSCEKCNISQELRGPELGKHVYLRVGTGNVELVGCEEHIKVLLQLVNEAINERRP